MPGTTRAHKTSQQKHTAMPGTTRSAVAQPSACAKGFLGFVNLAPIKPSCPTLWVATCMQLQGPAQHKCPGVYPGIEGKEQTDRGRQKHAKVHCANTIQPWSATATDEGRQVGHQDKCSSRHIPPAQLGAAVPALCLKTSKHLRVRTSRTRQAGGMQGRNAVQARPLR